MSKHKKKKSAKKTLHGLRGWLGGDLEKHGNESNQEATTTIRGKIAA
jgi:hypothetical protein